jgi:HNH endonuclease/AP2 domain
MKRIPLINSDKTVLVDDEDFDRVVKYKWRERSHRRTSYAYALVDIRDDVNEFYGTLHMQLHCYIMRSPKGSIVDHIDGNGLNNQRTNLRFVTHAQNMANRRLFAGRRFKGTVPPRGRSKKWEAQIRVDGKRVGLGRHHTEEEAARAYDAAAREHFGEYATLNFPNGAERSVRG